MALSKQAQSHTVPFVDEKPHHPLSFKFPKHEFGKKNTVKRSFQAQWFASGAIAGLGYITKKP